MNLNVSWGRALMIKLISFDMKKTFFKTKRGGKTMKIKIIAILLVAMGALSNAMAAGNSLSLKVKAEVPKASNDDNVQIQVYNQNTALPNANITVDLKESLDDLDNLVWGSTGKYLYFEGWPQIDPKNIYVVEVYSKGGGVTYNNLLETKCTDLSLKHTTDAKHLLTGNCAHLLVNDSMAPVYTGVPGAVPDALKQKVATPQYFEAAKEDYYNIPSGIKPGDALYIAVSFFAHLPAWGSDISGYPEGRYSVTSAMNIRASW